MKDLLEYLAKCLVEQPDEVEVTAVEDGSVVVLKLSVAEDDVGKVIGRQGRIVRALRTIVNACALKEGKRAVIEIVE